jgi:hypothetical protein
MLPRNVLEWNLAEPTALGQTSLDSRYLLLALSEQTGKLAKRKKWMAAQQC